jgi:hypothetical protein
MAMAAGPTAAIGVGSTAAGGVMGVIGSLFQGQAQSNMYKYQAGVAQVNAKVANQDAQYATEAGNVEATNSGLRTRAEVGTTRAGMAAGNVDINSGSGARVVSSETAIGQENEATIRANAAKRAYGFEVKAAGDTATAGAMDVAATTSIESGDIGAISSVIGAAGSVSSKWLQAGQVFGSGSTSTTASGSFPGTG